MNSESTPTHLLDLTLDDFRERCATWDLPAYRAKQIFEWVYRKRVLDFEQMTNLSKDLRQRISNEVRILTARQRRRQLASDGTLKFLLEWPDGATSECVLIPDGRRRTACISSQVGCPVRCAFCASGLNGLNRQLTAGEIVEQVMWVARQCEQPDELPSETPGSRPHRTPHRLSNLVFMGLGEPLGNYKNVLKAIRIINADWGINIGARSITVSTVGLPSQIRRLADENLQVNLAISLHAPNDKLREQLIPWASKTSVDEIVAAGRAYYEQTHREVTVEYILLANINDQPAHANELVKLCRRMRCNVNLIRYNPVPGIPFERPTTFAVSKFAERLRERGINVHVRKSRGLDIDAACGQLRRSTSDAAPPGEHAPLETPPPRPKRRRMASNPDA